VAAGRVMITIVFAPTPQNSKLPCAKAILDVSEVPALGHQMPALWRDLEFTVHSQNLLLSNPSCFLLFGVTGKTQP
jgi:hypothetical protein